MLEHASRSQHCLGFVATAFTSFHIEFGTVYSSLAQFRAQSRAQHSLEHSLEQSRAQFREV